MKNTASPTVNKISEIFTLSFCVLLFFGALTGAIKPIRYILQGDVLTAEVVHVEDQRRTGSTGEWVTITTLAFTDPLGRKKEFVYQEDDRSFLNGHGEGDRFEVLYRSDLPDKIVENHPLALFRLPFILLGVSLVCGGIFLKTKKGRTP